MYRGVHSSFIEAKIEIDSMNPSVKQRPPLYRLMIAPITRIWEIWRTKRSWAWWNQRVTQQSCVYLIRGYWNSFISRPRLPNIDRRAGYGHGMNINCYLYKLQLIRVAPSCWNSFGSTCSSVKAIEFRPELKCNSEGWNRTLITINFNHFLKSNAKIIKYWLILIWLQDFPPFLSVHFHRIYHSLIRSRSRLSIFTGSIIPWLEASSVVWGIPNSYLIRYIINTYLKRHRLGVD